MKATKAFFLIAMAFAVMAMAVSAAPIGAAPVERRGLLGWLSPVWKWLGMDKDGPSTNTPSPEDRPMPAVDVPSTASITERADQVAFFMAPHRKRPARIVALGDSYSAGFGADLRFWKADDRCRQGQRAYPNLLAEDMGEFDSLLDSMEAVNGTASLYTNSTAPGSNGPSSSASVSSSGGSSSLGSPGRLPRGEVVDDGDTTHPGSSLVRRGTTAPDHLLWLSCSGAITEDLMTFDDSRAYELKNTGGFSILDWFRKPLREGFVYDKSWPGPFLSADRLTRQIDAWQMTEDTDMAVISLGGNDLGFTPILTACVILKGDCKGAIDTSVQKLMGGRFKLRYFDMLDYLFRKADLEAHPWFKVTITGYAKFFNAVTDQCDEANFAVFPKIQTFMTKEIRMLMNELVDLIRTEQGKMVAEYNQLRFAGQPPKVLFVDIDGKFEGHRFCEPGIEEPSRGNPHNWFFNVLGWDHEVDEESQRYAARVEVAELRSVQFPKCLFTSFSKDGMATMKAFGLCLLRLAVDLDPSLAPPHWNWEGDMPTEEALALVPEAGDKIREAIKSAVEPLEEGLEKRGMPAGTISFMPTILGKVFHPKWAGHRAIRDAIYERWMEVGWAVPVADLLGLEMIQED